MRLLRLVLFIITIAVVGCRSEAKVIFPTDTVPPPRPEDIIGGGTPMPAQKAPAKPAK